MVYVFPNSPKDPNEIELFALDFTSRLATGETISSATGTMSVLVGTDAGAAAMIDGSATFSGGVVQQLIRNGLAGNVYLLTIEITTSLGQTLDLSGHLYIKNQE